MNRSAKFSVIVLMLAGGGTSSAVRSHATTVYQDPQAEVLAREALRRDAYMRLDSAAVAALLSAEYVSVSTEAPCCFHDRAGGIHAVILHRDAVDPHPITALRMDSTRVRIFGNTAIVTGLETIEMTYPRHVPVNHVVVRTLAANVWVKERGTWMLVSQQRTALR
jgi:hypothetical protein